MLDELPTLHQVPSLQPGLAESRQFGGCFVLGVQVISALRDLYGRNGAETVSGLCGTRVVLAAPDQETARWSAESLGRGEVTEYAEGLSYGASAMRDGVSLTQRREMRPLALPSEIMRLDNLKGYLKFPGPWPVARIELDYVNRPKAAESFVQREDMPAPVVDGVEAGPPENGDAVETSENVEEGAPATGNRQGEIEFEQIRTAGPEALCNLDASTAPAGPDGGGGEARAGEQRKLAGSDSKPDLPDGVDI